MTSLELSAPARSNLRPGCLSLAPGCLATVATLGALFFGEVMLLPPCVLCWYQRIFMFPLVLILPLGLFPFDRNVVRHALALAVPGALLATFHLLLVAGVIPRPSSLAAKAYRVRPP